MKSTNEWAGSIIAKSLEGSEISRWKSQRYSLSPDSPRRVFFHGHTIWARHTTVYCVLANIHLWGRVFNDRFWRCLFYEKFLLTLQKYFSFAGCAFDQLEICSCGSAVGMLCPRNNVRKNGCLSKVTLYRPCWWGYWPKANQACPRRLLVASDDAASACSVSSCRLLGHWRGT